MGAASASASRLTPTSRTPLSPNSCLPPLPVRGFVCIYVFLCLYYINYLCVFSKFAQVWVVVNRCKFTPLLKVFCVYAFLNCMIQSFYTNQAYY